MTLPSGARERTANSVEAVLNPLPVSTITGKSDQGGCAESFCASGPMAPFCKNFFGDDGSTGVFRDGRFQFRQRAQ